MKRKALIIGNTRGLQGVQKDVARFANFLKSPRGGAWIDSEIAIVQNPRKIVLLTEIARMKADRFDYAVVLFSGHGGHTRTTRLELNDDETIDEVNLQKIAPRQLNIYDCCRVLGDETILKSYATEAFRSATFDSARGIREIYDERIMQAIPQQVSLYACSVGECSYDTADGAVYLNALLGAAIADNGSRFVTVGSAHEGARNRMEAERRNLPAREPQNPDATLPKCLNSQQLVLAVNH